MRKGSKMSFKIGAKIKVYYCEDCGTFIGNYGAHSSDHAITGLWCVVEKVGI